MMNNQSDRAVSTEHHHEATTRADAPRALEQATTHGSGMMGQQSIDPVCGMTVDPHTAKHRTEHAGQPIYFCSSSCRAKFIADPDKYLTKTKAPAVAVPDGTIYTCPMHPEIRRAGPGACPICGMALEPELVTADSAPNAELADMTWRFWIGLALAVPVAALEMGGHLTGLLRSAPF